MLEFKSPVTASAPLKYPREPLRAENNLSYLEFIALLKKLWQDANPLIPFKPIQSQSYAFTTTNPEFEASQPESTDNPKYLEIDCMMVYSLELRKPNANEPKMRLREEVVTTGEVNYLVQGQRFENLIIFSALSKGGPELAESVIEAFEDFMLEYTPVFKRLGVSEILYSRRTPDDEQSRFSEDLDKRSVAYIVVIEKLRAVEIAKIEEIILNVRQFLSTNVVDPV
jgi:hypothetical protein